MSKVIVERSRRGGDDGYKWRKNRRQAKRNPEEAPQPRSMRGFYGWDKKALNENLNPLERFLNAQVGRPWNDVYSEVCANIKLSNAVQRHILEHLDHMVEVNVIMGVTKVCALGICGRIQLYGGELYVHPETGLLCKVPGSRYPWRKDKKGPTYAELNRYIDPKDDLKQYHRVNGIWYEVTLEEPDEESKRQGCLGYWVNSTWLTVPRRYWVVGWPCPMFEKLSQAWGGENSKTIFGRLLKPVKIRQLNTQEIKRVKRLMGKGR